MITEQLIFSANNPAIAGHKVYGKLMLPGLAYIDIFCQFSKKLGLSPGQFELRHLTIHHSMIVETDAKLVVSVWGEKDGSDRWKIGLEGRKLFATAEVVSVAEGLACADMNINLLKESASRVYPISEVYTRYRSRGLWHEGFIRAAGEIYELGDGLIFQGSVGPEARATAQSFLFHPALMDGSAVATMHLFDELITEEENLFVPFYMESFFASALINKNCNAYISNDFIGRKNEVVSMSICFFDETGRGIGKITNLSSKMVGDIVRPRPREEQYDGKETDAVVLFLKELIGNHLGISPDAIDPHLDYYYIGFDSASLLQLARIIGSKTGVDLPPTLLFEYPNIAQLAEHLSGVYAGSAGSLNLT
jgi:polyketide synthase PksM